MAPSSQAVPRLETRAANKSTHPGNITKTGVPRRTPAEAKKLRETKAAAKAQRQAAKTKSIVRTAEFEHADMANEDLVDATPRPPCTPKPWPPLRNKKKAKLVPTVAESEPVDDPVFDNSPLTPVASEESVTEDESLADAEDESVTEDESEIEYIAPPTKKQKIKDTEKAIRKEEASAEKGKKVDRDEKVMVAPDEEQTPKPKKGKGSIREEINFAAKKLENDVKGDKYSAMVKSMSSKPPSQLQAAGGRGKKLKREGAIADINALYIKKGSNPDQNVSTGNNNKDQMDIDNG